MPDESFRPAMSQKIFSMGFDVETVSVYLLCCAVADANTSITRQVLTDKWNGKPASLDDGLRRLEERGILRVEDQSSPAYELVNDARWT